MHRWTDLDLSLLSHLHQNTAELQVVGDNNASQEQWLVREHVIEHLTPLVLRQYI